MILIKYLWYYFFWIIVRIGLRIYYSKVKITGLENIPKNKPIIFGANHENAFIDALLITTSNTRFDHYLVRAGVFKNPVARAFLNSLNLMPVYRAQDGVNPLEANQQIFRACFEALAKNYAVMLFPEGEHNMRRHKRVLKKGITRIALGAVNFEDKIQEVSVVPVGVNYSDHMGFRSAVHIVFGKPIDVQKQEQNAENYKKLTTEITEALSQVHVSLDRTSYLGQEAIFFHDQNPHQLIFPEKINQAAAQLQNQTEVVQEIEDQRIALEKEGLSFPFRPIHTVGKIQLILLFIPALFGLIVNSPVLIPVYLFIKNKVKEPEFVASLKFGFSLFGLLIWWSFVNKWIVEFSGEWYFGALVMIGSIFGLIALNGTVRKWKRLRMSQLINSDATLASQYEEFTERIKQLRTDLYKNS